jgi:hypothetical protein
MLRANNYTQKYIDECRSRVAAQVSAYQTLVPTARIKPRLMNRYITLQWKPLNLISLTTCF